MVDGDSGRGPLPSTKDYYPAIDELLDYNPEEVNKFLATVNKSNLTCFLREALSRLKSTTLIVDSISAVEKSIKSVSVTPAAQTVISNPSTSPQSETLQKNRWNQNSRHTWELISNHSETIRRWFETSHRCAGIYWKGCFRLYSRRL